MWPMNLGYYFTMSLTSLALPFFLFFHSQPVASYFCAYQHMFESSCYGSGPHNSSQKQEVWTVCCFYQ